MATRIAIRSYIKTLVAPHVATAFDYRPSLLLEHELPAAMIYFEAGETDRDFEGDEETRASLAIEIYARADTDLDGALDAIGALIGAGVKQDRELGGLVDYISRSGFSYDRDPEAFEGSLSLIFTVLYDDED